MILKYHIQMTRAALSPYFSERALEIIIAANLKQDDLKNQIGHDEIHYDNNAIDKGDRYIIEQRGTIIATLLSPGILAAWIAFGRMLHTAQDFYAHTNYVSLWLDQFDGAPPPPAEVDPLKKDLVKSPNLRSGKIYFPLDWLYFIKPLRPLILKFLPKDSHGWMNLDSPEQGPKFDYALAAATKRTEYELDLLRKLLTPEMFARFTDKQPV
ncbi:MAG TPA: hypothetical protein PK152_09725 [Anaerolineales bacterium]|nr:hypothetical protein [Anaerolineales bacterium]HRK89400.1 hypothetical protein [Anaerolineales bacterium]